jgi:uncharacterized protein YabN with tetrapyrrole methylase and pyrophosphatase domain
MNAVARTLPALWRAEKIQKKAAHAGFNWPEGNAVLDKLEEETKELRQAAQDANRPADAPHGVAEEVGDVLFVASEIAYRHGVDPEAALHQSCDKFVGRFRFMEEQGFDAGLSMEDKVRLWNRAKEEEKMTKSCDEIAGGKNQ